VDLPLQDWFVTSLKTKTFGGLMYDRMRNLFHLALTLSLIIALLLRRFNHESHSRPSLMAVSLSFVLTS
jgi:hypothetical protein